MTVLFVFLGLLLILVVGLPMCIVIHQAIKRGRSPVPPFTMEEVFSRVAREYREDDQQTVLELLDRWRTPGVSEILLAQMQLSILQLAKGDIGLVKKYMDECDDYRDIILQAGYG